MQFAQTLRRQARASVQSILVLRDDVLEKPILNKLRDGTVCQRGRGQYLETVHLIVPRRILFLRRLVTRLAFYFAFLLRLCPNAVGPAIIWKPGVGRDARARHNNAVP